MSVDRTNGDGGLERLRDVLDAYGAELERWPAAERDALSAVLARSAAARRLREDAARLDAALDALPAVLPSPDLEARILAAASAAAGPRTVSSIAVARARRDAGARRGAGWLTVALPLAAAAALAVWLTAGRDTEPAVRIAGAPAAAPAGAPTGDAALAEIALAELGVYETPGDELLEISGLDDVYEAAPWDGCAAGELGCLEMDTLPLEPVSRDETKGQEVRLLA